MTEQELEDKRVATERRRLVILTSLPDANSGCWMELDHIAYLANASVTLARYHLIRLRDRGLVQKRGWLFPVFRRTELGDKSTKLGDIND